jgi:hypothetical protein
MSQVAIISQAALPTLAAVATLSAARRGTFGKTVVWVDKESVPSSGILPQSIGFATVYCVVRERTSSSFSDWLRVMPYWVDQVKVVGWSIRPATVQFK